MWFKVAKADDLQALIGKIQKRDKQIQGQINEIQNLKGNQVVSYIIQRKEAEIQDKINETKLF